MTLALQETPDDVRPDIFARLSRMGPEARKAYLRSLDQEQRMQLLKLSDERKANPYFGFRDDPVGFVTSQRGLGEVAWSLQNEIMRSVWKNKRTAVPACHAPGKSHIAARIIAWWGSVHPAGTARILTTATTFRQVRNVLWPYIRRVHAMHNLPGEMNMVEWYMGKGADRTLVAEGVKPPDDDEAAMSGLHYPHTLIVVDEAGGISHNFGRGLLGLLTGSHTRLLLIGNPPIDDEGSWFEKQCEREDLYKVIPIPWKLTPNFTGEYVGWCRSHPEMEPHLVNEHLIDESYVEELTAEYGEGSAVVIARRDAQFPKTNESRTLPIMWLEAAQAVNTGLEELWDVHEPGRITLGVDPGAGGDEFVIAEIDNWWARIRHAKSEAANRDPEFVLGKILEHAQDAAATHRKRGISKPVRVKVDSLGIGYGIFGSLKTWERENPGAGVTFVEVRAGDNATDSDHFVNRRAEMWWGMRKAIEPDKVGRQLITFARGDLTDTAVKQLNAPKYKVDAHGRLQIEKKDDMKKRGIKSPDRADAIVMALYEPEKVIDFAGISPIIIESNPKVLPPETRTTGSSGIGFIGV